MSSGLSDNKRGGDGDEKEDRLVLFGKEEDEAVNEMEALTTQITGLKRLIEVLQERVCDCCAERDWWRARHAISIHASHHQRSSPFPFDEKQTQAKGKIEANGNTNSKTSSSSPSVIGEKLERGVGAAFFASGASSLSPPSSTRQKESNGRRRPNTNTNTNNNSNGSNESDGTTIHNLCASAANAAPSPSSSSSSASSSHGEADANRDCDFLLRELRDQKVLVSSLEETVHLLKKQVCSVLSISSYFCTFSPSDIYACLPAHPPATLSLSLSINLSLSLFPSLPISSSLSLSLSPLLWDRLLALLHRHTKSWRMNVKSLQTHFQSWLIGTTTAKKKRLLDGKR